MRLFRRDDGRYYAIAAPEADLLGDMVVMTFHGNQKSRAGGIKTYVAGIQDPDRVVEEIVKTRLAHGYAETLMEIPEVLRERSRGWRP